MPSAAASTVCLSRSATNNPTDIRLKPKRASIRKIRYRLNGRSISAAITAMGHPAPEIDLLFTVLAEQAKKTP